MTVNVSIEIESGEAVTPDEVADAVAEFLWGVELTADDDRTKITINSVSLDQ
jgi:hypothetical protein